ncbi:MAG: flavoprotein [Thermodesulfobacteriota bacterium]
MNLLQKRKVVLAVTGGISAFKSPELASRLISEGAVVRAAMTRAAMRFITPLTFEVVTRNPVWTDPGRYGPVSGSAHEELAWWAEAVVVAPATANIIAKMAAGLAEDFMSAFLLTLEAPAIICPSMSEAMLEHPAVKANLARLEARGHRVVEPGPGHPACGWEDRGRLPDLNVIMEEVRCALSWKDVGGLRLAATRG